MDAKGKRIIFILLFLLSALCFAIVFAGCGDKDDKNEECEHDWGSWTATVVADCVTDGSEMRVCGKDSSHTETRKIEKLGHSFVEYVSCGDATCTDDGTKTATCSREDCSVTDTLPDVGSAVGHAFTRETATVQYQKTAATCTAKAVYYKSCVCGEKGADTFAFGELAAHSYGEAWLTDVASHWHKCADCVDVTGTAAHSGGTATCAAKAECGVCGVEYGSLAAHAFTRETATAQYQKTAATCTAKAVYYKSCVCGEKGADTFAFGELAAHSYGEWTNMNAASHSRACVCGDTQTENHDLTERVARAAACAERGLKVVSCSDCDYEKQETLNPTSHTWNAEEVTCTEGRACTADGCEAYEPMLGHDYVRIDERSADCENAAAETYACSHCGDRNEIIVALAVGHHAEAWEKSDIETPIDGETCKVTQTYTAICENCGEELTKQEVVDKHSLQASIQRAATCQDVGVMLYTCSAAGCEYTKSEEYSDASAHSWGEGVTENGVTAYSCSAAGCDATKKTISSKGSTATTVTGDTLKSVDEIELLNATIAMDADTANALDGQIDISADRLTADEIVAQGGVLDEQLISKLGDNPVYNFSVAADGSAVTDFNGYVTVRVPYTLADGEDPECIAVWYIGSDGTVKSIQAVYSDGFAVFVTDHFSYYTVTRLTPAERCALYGHSYRDTVQDPTCVANGYTLHVCQRCGHSEKTDIKPATGHDCNPTPTAATCATEGSVLYSCRKCDYSYTVRIPVLGHTWNETESRAATCEAAGFVCYGCVNCDAAYLTTLAQKQHRYQPGVTQPTCTEQGYTTYTCADCEHGYRSDFKRALGHAYAANVVAPTCTADGYTEHSCTRCDISYRSDTVLAGHRWNIDAPDCGRGQECLVCGEDGLPATGEHRMQNGICAVCGEGCSHGFESVTVKPTCTERGYLLETCSDCGQERKSNFVDALGHLGEFVCGRCFGQILGENFFANAFSDLLNREFAIRVDDVRWTVNEYGYSIEFAELLIRIGENGETAVCGTGSASWETGTPVPGMVDVIGVIRDGKFYARVEFTMSGLSSNTNAVSVSDNITTQYIVTPVDQLSNALFGSSDPRFHIISELTDVYAWYRAEWLPIVNEILTLNKTEISLELSIFASSLFNVEKDGNGYVLTLDASSLLALSDALCTSSIAESLDVFFGDGTFDKIKADLLTFAGSTLDEVMTAAESKGLDIPAVLGALDKLVYRLSGGAVSGFDELLSSLAGVEINIEELLASEQFGNTTVLELLNSFISGGGTAVPDVPVELIDDSAAGGDDAGAIPALTLESLAAMIDQAGSMNFYELLAGGDQTAAADLKERVSGILDAALNACSLSVRLTGDGYILSVGIEASGELFGGSVELLPDYVSSTDYGVLVSEIERLAAAIDVDNVIAGILPEDMETIRGEDGSIFASFEISTENIEHEKSDGEYTVRFVTVISASGSFEVSRNPVLLLSYDCGDWVIARLGVNMDYVYSRQYFERIYGADGTLITEQAHLTDDEKYYGLYYIDFRYHLGTGKWEIADNAFESKHRYVEDVSAHVPATGCDGFGQQHFYCTDCGSAYIRYYTIGHTGISASYKFATEEADCESGYYIEKSCGVCGEQISREYFDSHDPIVVEKEFDLSGTSACDRHRVYYAKCPCGIQGIMIVEDVDENGMKHTSHDTYSCPDCMLTVECKTFEKEITDCMATEKVRYTVRVDCEEVETYDVKRIYENHSLITYVQLAEGVSSCEDGVFTRNICSECGRIEADENPAYGHIYGIVELVDLTEYGAAEGTLIRQGCACGQYNESNWKIDGIYETYEESIDNKYITIHTFLSDGFVVRIEEYSERAGCVIQIKNRILIGYDVSDGSFDREIISVIRELVEHDARVVGSSLVGESCEDGVYLTFACRTCESVREENYQWHYVFEKEYVDLSQFGAVCESGFVIYGCACGYENSGRFESQCDFGLSIEIEYTDEYNRYYVYVCAVTDPVKCEFLYGERLFQDGCVVYQTVYFGCDREGNNAKMEFTFKFAEMHTHDEILVSSAERCYYHIIRKCTVCDQIFGEYDDYRHQYVQDRVRVGPCYYLVTNICSVCGDSAENYQNKHDRIDLRVNDSTCSQFGTHEYTCECGEIHEAEIFEPLGHSWIFMEDTGLYVCGMCGLENSNGADGSVVLEDCGEKDGDVLVGYWLRDYWLDEQHYDGKYLLCVTLILHEPNADGDNQILVENAIVSRVDGEGNYVSFSKTEVETLAEGMGYAKSDYDIRLSFVPVGGDGTLDYGITFTDNTAA